jgi:hypothetical protein
MFPFYLRHEILSVKAVLSNRASGIVRRKQQMGLPCKMAVAKYLIESRRSSLVPQSEAAWVLLALAVVWFALFFRLGHLPLLQPDEGRNAEVAREMKESGAWLSPSYDGIAYLDKPAFYFKAVALSLAAFGNNETAARLPSAVFGLATLALAFGFCRRVYGARCAGMALINIATAAPAWPSSSSRRCHFMWCSRGR